MLSKIINPKLYIKGNPVDFLNKDPRHLSYNRLPLLANVIYDLPNYIGTGITPQYSYNHKTSTINSNDIVFIKTDLLDKFLHETVINIPIIIVTGVSDISPSDYAYNKIITNPNILSWIGTNIVHKHSKIKKVLIGVGEPERSNSNHSILRLLHESRVLWKDKFNEICIPYHRITHISRKNMKTLPKLEFQDYMREISKYKFIICKRGNGIDTHRFSEILLMGSVPVIEHSGLDDLYTQFPCIFEDDDTNKFIWDDKKYEKFLDMFWLRDTFIEEYIGIKL